MPFPKTAGAIPPRAGCSAGVAQLAEHQPSKLRVAGSNPVSRSTRPDGPGGGASGESQLAGSPFRPRGSVVEHFLGKEGVIGSIPIVGSTPVPAPGPAASFGARVTIAGIL